MKRSEEPNSTYYENDPDKTIKENERLIYYILRTKMNRDDLIYDDDMIQMARLGIFKAWKTYDPENSAWSTYMSRCVTNEIFMELRRRRSPKNKFYESCDRLDRVIEDGEGGTCELQDLLKFDDNSYDSVINEYERRWNEIYNSLSLREKSIIYWLDLNYTQKEIGEMMGISQPYASRLITKLRSKIQEKWKESE